MKFAVIASCLCVLLLTSNVVAWHGPGHYIVAHIAQTYLQQNNPDALDWANKILAPYTDVCGENLYPFVEAATWPDKIKDQGWHIFDNHHFMSNYWYTEGGVPKAFQSDTFANIIFAIGENVDTLSSNRVDPYGSSKSIFGKSLSLRTLIHFIGDIHQPLHAEERVTAKKPNGDMGGNLFYIKHYNDSHMDNLHFIWDEMFMPYNTSIRTNLPPEKYQFIDEWSKGIQAEYTFESLKPQIQRNGNQKAWSDESFAIAKSFAYNGLYENQDLPQLYQDMGRDICRQRVALGGYRLGITLDAIFKKIVQQGNDVESKYVDKLISFMGDKPKSPEYRLKKIREAAGQVSE